MGIAKGASLLLVLAVIAAIYDLHADALNVVPRAWIGAARSHGRKFMLESTGTELRPRPYPHGPIYISPSPIEIQAVEPQAEHQHSVISSFYPGIRNAELDSSPVTSPPDFGSPSDTTMEFSTLDSTVEDGRMHIDYHEVQPNPPSDGHDYPPGPPLLD